MNEREHGMMLEIRRARERLEKGEGVEIQTRRGLLLALQACLENCRRHRNRADQAEGELRDMKKPGGGEIPPGT